MRPLRGSTATPSVSTPNGSFGSSLHVVEKEASSLGRFARPLASAVPTFIGLTLSSSIVPSSTVKYMSRGANAGTKISLPATPSQVRSLFGPRSVSETKRLPDVVEREQPAEAAELPRARRDVDADGDLLVERCRAGHREGS